MSIKTDIVTTKTVSLWLWGIAILAILIVVGILGWQLFYGFVIPQANSAVTLPLTGIGGKGSSY